MSSSISPSPDKASPAGGLGTLAVIIADFASVQPLEESIARSLSLLRGVVDASECAIWLRHETIVYRAWGSGDAVITASEVQAGLATAASHSQSEIPRAPLILSIRSGGRESGALAFKLTRDLGDDELLLVTAVANLLAPELAHAEKNRQLEVEVEARTA